MSNTVILKFWGDLFECCGALLDVMVFLHYLHHPHLPLDHCSLLGFNHGAHLYLHVCLDQALCGWSGVIWGMTLRLITCILRSYITNSHSLQGITWSFLIIYKIKINLLHLRAISLIKHHITCDFNTIGVLVENTICA
jgi:hypothetical protein